MNTASEASHIACNTKTHAEQDVLRGYKSLVETVAPWLSSHSVITAEMNTEMKFQCFSHRGLIHRNTGLCKRILNFTLAPREHDSSQTDHSFTLFSSSEKSCCFSARFQNNNHLCFGLMLPTLQRHSHSVLLSFVTNILSGLSRKMFVMSCVKYNRT